MKIHSVEEAKNVPLLRQGRHTLVHAELLKLKPGEKLTIEKGKDWFTKTPPHQLVRRFAIKQNWELICGHSDDGKNYVVQRLK
jgi:hypothetical protein